MERNKLETQFKEQLNSREIKPSDRAWDRLDTMLTVAEKKKQKRSYAWIYAAASFVGFLSITTFYFSQKENTIQNQKNGVVIQNSVAPKTDATPSEKVDLKMEEKGSIVNVVRQSTSKSDKFSGTKQESIMVQNNLNQNQVAELSIINQKNEQGSISSQTNAITVDELLAKVDKSARLTNKTNPNLEVHVNANHLLLQVENDLEPTFRQSVFSKIAENVKVVKEAVVNRNKE